MSSTDGTHRVPSPRNEPVLNYAPGSPERRRLEAELRRQESVVIDIPCVVGGREHFTGKVVEVTMPCAHGHVLARAHLATPELVARSTESLEAHRREWAALPWTERVAVFLRAADLLAGPWRERINASTMLGQSKTCHQAEIDSACEIIDFWRFNAYFTEQIMSEQPQSGPGVWNRLDHRGLEGFVFAITPFNFTSIAYNLASAPAMMGNVTLWKPATTQLLSAWYGYQLMLEAGLPPGVIDFVPGHGADVGDAAIDSPLLAGLHFTGSTGTMRHLWRQIAGNIDRYKSWPRIVGETGGKDFIVAHESADVDALATAIVRGAFEYQGQKCSAASRIYVPNTLWAAVEERVVGMMSQMKQGDVRDFGNFVGAVIDRKAFDSHRGYLELAHTTADVRAGGKANGEVGWFVQPTLVRVDDPHHRLMEEEIFGPIATAWVYPAAQWTETLATVDATSPYALTGAVFARDRYAVESASTALRQAAGNFYINDKPTGAVVGQQPFGGARASGTNDKAGSMLNLLRWVSPRTIKETFVPPTDWRYDFLG
jgi:1-pyrroline-5-carboxylate dehydrogenase